MSVESLKVFFDIAAVVLLFLTFVAGAGVLITGNIISDRQADKLRQFDQNLTAAKTELGRQEERAANAELGQEKLKNANLKLEERIAQQGHRNVRLLASQDQFAAALKPFAGQKFEIGPCSEFADDWEVWEFRTVLESTLSAKSSWVSKGLKYAHVCTTGVAVYVRSTSPPSTREAAATLAKSLDNLLGRYAIGKLPAYQVGLVVTSPPTPPAVNGVESSEPDTILIVVGEHP
jgi:hypothetical protein